MSEAAEPDVNGLLGTVHALLLFAQVLAHTSSIREMLLTHIKAAEQAGLATIEGLPVNEKVVESYQFAMGEIKKVLEISPPEGG